MGSPEDDRADFLAFCQEYGFTEAELLEMTLREDDQVPMPPQFNALHLADSPRHGRSPVATVPDDGRKPEAQDG